MPDQITDSSINSGAAYTRSESRSGASDGMLAVGDVAGQARAVGTVREQYNPLGAGLRSIWPQSVVGF
ncbi:hypothetical protein [Paenarthrobacter ilicis]|uniref:hypothetical protein n=1 Tax=Paenarthrobacter ilicis TaxID=43665 RepID=UPI0028D1486B|nr:hypothetical protein [Paenarthrobacter ilicis]